MKKIVIGFLMLLGMLIADDIVWQKDLSSVLELAKNRTSSFHQINKNRNICIKCPVTVIRTVHHRILQK